ncbi:MAG: thiamine-phosphate synthase family protein [Promethearchaeota archaeon]
MKNHDFFTIQWLIKESLNKTGKIPDILWYKGSVGKEAMIR